MKIAITITTFNRPAILLRGLAEQMKYLPIGPDIEAKIFIVDDGSSEQVDERELSKILVIPNSPFESTYFKQIENKGIAAAKNKCLELADEWGADHIFLFDSDTWPRVQGWEQPYITSKEPHLMYIFEQFATAGKGGHNLSDCVEIYRDSEKVAYSHVRGCMLYVDRKVLDVVGGFDERYGKAMFEHTDFSNRIHNAGLTSFRVMDVPDSQSLIYAMDEYREAQSSISREERSAGLASNRARWTASMTSTEYCEYRTELSGDRDIVLTSYFTSAPDFQRKNQNWAADYSAIEPLINSVTKQGIDVVLLHDCFDLPNRVECTMDPYWNRFLRAYEYLRDNPDVRRVFMTDATDVTMLNNPFGRMDPRKIYCGDEKALLGCRWISERAWLDPYRQFVRMNRNLRLLNVGLLGGSRKDVMMVLHDMLTLYADSKMKVNDMVAFNYLMRGKYADRLAHGTGLVNNRFKSFEPTAEAAEWFMHK